MTATDDLVAEIQRLLINQNVSYNSASAVWDVYEGFMFSQVVATARQCGAAVSYRDVSGNVVNDLIFRTSPGHLHSARRRYTHAFIEFPDASPMEAHIGVMVQGKSGVLHECDVLVLPEEEAAICREQQIAPRGNQCVLIIECKYYTSGLRLAQARNFEGLRVDVSAEHELFVSNVGAPSVTRYLRARRRQFERDVTPSDLVQVGNVRSEIRKAFKYFLNTYNPSYPV